MRTAVGYRRKRGMVGVVRALVRATGALLVGGCAMFNAGAAPEAAPRPPIDAPSRFVLDPAFPETPIASTPGQGCRSPLFDPRDGARLRLIRSASDRGDYEAPEGRYGVNARELIRVNCYSGEVLGIVKR